MRTPVPEYLHEILESCRGNTGGEVATYIPELGQTDPDLFGIAMCTPAGTVYSTGDADAPFTIQSASKPFVYAVALRERGLDVVNFHVDVEPSGDPFNEMSVDSETGKPSNPMINMGAITTHCLVGDSGLSPMERSEIVRRELSRFAGRELSVNETVLESEFKHRYRNVALASMARSNGFILLEPDDAVWGYTRQSAIVVTARDLAVMAMTLANGGVNPLTLEQVVPQWVCRQVLSVMATCGMYDSAGDWLSNIGIPAKSGVGGGILGALPGQVGIGTFSPRLDQHGNSVRGVEACERLSRQLGLHLMELPAPSIDAIGQQSTTESGAVLVALQGALTFPSGELMLRRFEEIPMGGDEIVVDLTLVPSINVVGDRMLREGLRRLGRDGHEVTLIDPYERIPNPVAHDRSEIPVVDDLETYEEA
ncbi:glutaminase [Gulosibacter sp. 10]|uniref:glutaminase n=1 Tax=Gulosibacter sp. 10 TaxID=1255570 RepID=UPI00097F577C|nr:glutaminase [Gulosibacter sp. 10]SJM53136.1 Glutaminase [Gulosibacter sp. 10]